MQLGQSFELKETVFWNGYTLANSLLAEWKGYSTCSYTRETAGKTSDVY